MSNKHLTIIDSKKENCPLAPGESYEKYVSLDRGEHNMSTVAGRVNDHFMDYEEVGWFLIDVYLRDGKCIASSRTNYVPNMITIMIPTNLSVKIKVTRSLECTYDQKMHFILDDIQSLK